MTTIRHHKKQARLRAAANGTSHQAELNAIAREHGHAAWGAFQKAVADGVSSAGKESRTTPLASRGSLYDSMTDKERRVDDELKRQRYNMRPIQDPAGELKDLIDAYESARRAGGHLVVVRPTPEREEAVIELLWNQQDDMPGDSRLEGIAFTPFLDQEGVAMQDADSHGHTLVAGSGGMERDMHTHSGHFIVQNPAQKLMQMNALYSKRDQEIIYATTAVKYDMPQNDGETVRLIQKAVGDTTIKVSRRRSDGRSAATGGN